MNLGWSTTMVYEPDFLDLLEQHEIGPFEGEAFRHMLASYPPDRANSSGARWNPPDVPAIYMSLKRRTALAEAEHRLNLEPFRTRASRTLYRIDVAVARVVRLKRADLRRVGVTETLLHGLDFSACQRVGGAVAWLGCDALIVPSARGAGDNLVIFTANLTLTSFRFEVLEQELIDTK